MTSSRRRIEAAKEAATAFVERQPSTIKIGVVAFGDGAVTTLAAEQCEGGRDRGDQAPLGGRRHLARPGPPHVAQRDRREAAHDRRGGAGARRRRRGHRLLRLVRDRAALRRREHGGASTRWGSPRSHRPPASASTQSESAPKRGRSSRSTGSASRRRSTKACSRRSPRSRTAPTTKRATPSRSPGSTSRSISSSSASRSPAETRTPLFAAAGGLLLALGSVLSIAWFGRVI